MPDTTGTKERAALSRERVLAAAMALADGEGLEALTMRRLGDQLGVEAMSIYHHVPGKEAILDALVDRAFAEVESEAGGFDSDATPSTWQAVLRERILTSRRVMLRHRWAPVVLNSRSVLVPTMARYVDGIVGIMHAGGLSYDLIHHALHALGSRLFGFVLEMTLDGEAAEGSGEDLTLMREFVPHLAAMLQDVVHDDPADETLGWCDDQTEFEFALDLVLDGLERRR